MSPISITKDTKVPNMQSALDNTDHTLVKYLDSKLSSPANNGFITSPFKLFKLGDGTVLVEVRFEMFPIFWGVVSKQVNQGHVLYAFDHQQTMPYNPRLLSGCIIMKQFGPFRSPLLKIDTGNDQGFDGYLSRQAVAWLDQAFT